MCSSNAQLQSSTISSETLRIFKDLIGKLRPPADETTAILQRYLDADFIVFPMSDIPATSEQIAAIGRRFGVTYPAEFVAHVCGRFPGLYVEVKESIWPRPKEFDVGPFWSFLYAFHTYTPVADSPDWMRLDAAATTFQEKTDLPAAPILRLVGDANLYCVDANGAIVRFDHETGELQPVKLNFWQVFEHETSELLKRKKQKTAGEG
jgi:hypothetical protein